MRYNIDKISLIILKIFIIISILMIGIIIVISKKKEDRLISQVNQIKQAQEISEDGISLIYEKTARKGDIVEILITITENKSGLKNIEFPDGDILSCNGKNIVGIDYKVEFEKEYKFKITSENGDKKEEIIKISKPIIPEPIITLDQEPYTEMDGVKWYPYGTNVTITFAEDMTEYIGYYNFDNNTVWNSNGKNTTYTTKLTEIITIRGKMANEEGEESDIVEEKIHISPLSNNRIQDNYIYKNKEKRRYPVLVTGEKRSNVLYGTNIYFYSSYINQAAVHMGLVGIGEEKVLIIEIVEEPEEGYVGSTRNGIVSKNSNISKSYNGYTFIGENGERIKCPTIESISQVPSENEITIGIEATAYNGAEISKYYYKIDDEEYIESENATYTFTEVKPYINHTISVYAKDTNGSVTEVRQITQRTTKEIPTPIIEVDQEPYATIDGVEWYPYGTNVIITFAENMEDLSGYIRWNEGQWSSAINNSIYKGVLDITYKVEAQIMDKTGQLSEIVEKEINISPIVDGYIQRNYIAKNQEKRKYPVLVTGQNGRNVYGTDIYDFRSYINEAAVHMGLAKVGEEKVLMIEIVDQPEEGYIGSSRNEIVSRNDSGNASYNGYTFIGENGERIKCPTIENINQVPSENEITIGIEATAYNGAEISKYYYKIDNEEYIESENATHIFTELKPYINHTISVYAKDTNGSVTEVRQITQRTTKKIPTPIIEVDQEPYTTIDGVEWYPYGTNVIITFAEDMENLTGYIRWNEGQWSSAINNSTYKGLLDITYKVEAQIMDKTGQLSEIVEKEINISPIVDGYIQRNYIAKNQEKRKYPVLVTGQNGRNVYGTDIYDFRSYINEAAVHMGLVKVGEEKVLMIEIVDQPEEGYIGSSRNGIVSRNDSGNASYNGYTFIGKNGERIKCPTIESISGVPSENEITVGIEATAYNGAEISKYYYKIDDEEYIESESSTYVYTGIPTDVKHKVSVYIKDTNDCMSEIQEIETPVILGLLEESYKEGEYVKYEANGYSNWIIAGKTDDGQIILVSEGGTELYTVVGENANDAYLKLDEYCNQRYVDDRYATLSENYSLSKNMKGVINKKVLYGTKEATSDDLLSRLPEGWFLNNYDTRKDLGVYSLDNSHSWSYTIIGNEIFIRPVVYLKKGIKYSNSDGTKQNPYQLIP